MRNNRKNCVSKRDLLKDRIASERKARIERMAQAYAKGTYTVDAHAIAGRMIDAALGRQGGSQ
jgi:anti-sigma28 factor (negative regulator of flagellin synthesis)